VQVRYSVTLAESAFGSTFSQCLWPRCRHLRWRGYPSRLWGDMYTRDTAVMVKNSWCFDVLLYNNSDMRIYIQRLKLSLLLFMSFCRCCTVYILLWCKILCCWSLQTIRRDYTVFSVFIIYVSFNFKQADKSLHASCPLDLFHSIDLRPPFSAFSASTRSVASIHSAAAV